MNKLKNFLIIGTVIFLTGCVSNQSFYLKVDSVNGFTLLSYEDFNLETNSENLSPEVNPIVLEAIESRLVSELELRGLDSSKDSNLVLSFQFQPKMRSNQIDLVPEAITMIEDTFTLMMILRLKKNLF